MLSNEEPNWNDVFPMKPYDIQRQFASSLYGMINKKKVGFFESPTGTGKSLSIISGAFKWLEDNKDNYELLYKKFQGEDSIEEKKKDNDGLPDWINNIDASRKANYIQRKKKEKEEIKSLFSKKEYDKKKSVMTEKVVKEKKEGDSDEELVIDYESEPEEDIIAQLTKKIRIEEKVEENLAEDNDNLRIIYCSRTHTQIKQFVNEIKRTRFATRMKIITLGSRQNTCVNSNVYKLANITEINYKCMRIREKSEYGCSYYDAGKVKELSQELFEKITDIEDMFNLGKKMQSCPYYASKKLAPFVDVICIPYICLLHDKTREQLKIPLKNSIIIVDECHNFMEALYQIYSFSLTYRHLAQAFSQITAYKEKFKKRLKQKTLLYIDQIVRLLNSVMTFLKEKHKAKGSENQSSHQLIDFLIDLKLDKYDFFKLEAFIQDSQISKKILGYSEKQASTQTQIPKTESSRPSPIDEVNIEEIKATKDVATLERFLEFLIALIRSNDSDSRLIVTLSDKIVDSSLKIVNMEPARYIDNILKECISMIFAGGTLQPISEFFPIMDMVGQDQVVQFSCDHIIPNENFQACNHDNDCEQLINLDTIKGGNTVKELNFNYSNRNDSNYLKDLADMIHFLSLHIPEGVIVFLQSYAYLETIHEYLLKKQYFNIISPFKKMYFDLKSNPVTKDIFKEYSDTIKQNEKGAILFTVIGGKLSEGINFSDGLARAVVIVGLPYANYTDIELKERMKHLDKKAEIKRKEQSYNPKEIIDGRIYYENLCIKAVNQSIGRAIRHKNDYALAFLIDSRFANENIKNNLPGWVKKRVTHAENLSLLEGDIKSFFNSKKHSV